MSVNKEYMSLYRDFFDGVDMAGVSDLSEADKEYKAIDFGKAILAINKSLKESIPNSENALKELAEKLLDPNTEISLDEDGRFPEPVVLLNGEKAFRLGRRGTSYFLTFEFPVVSAEAFTRNCLRIVQAACEEKGVECADLLEMPIREKMVEKMVDYFAKGCFRLTNVYCGLEEVVFNGEKAYIFYVNSHPLLLQLNSKNEPIAVLVSETGLEFDGIEDGYPLTNSEKNFFEKYKTQIAEIGLAAIWDKFELKIQEQFYSMKMSVSKDRKTMVVKLENEVILEFESEHISDALNYDSITKTMHGDLVGYCKEVVPKCVGYQVLMEKLDIPDIKGFVEKTESEFIKAITVIVDKKLHVMPDVEIVSVEDSDSEQKDDFTFEELMNMDDNEIPCGNQCLINGVLYDFCYRKGKISEIDVAVFDGRTHAYVEDDLNAHLSYKWIMNHEKEICKEIDYLVKNGRQKRVWKLV